MNARFAARFAHSHLLLFCLVTPFQRAHADPLFAAKVDYPTTAFPSCVAIADLNGDTKLDLAVSGSPNTLSVLLGNGDATFAPKVNYATLAAASSVAIGDLNGDGKPDLVASNYNAIFPSVSVLLGHGDGTFEPKVDYGTGGRPYSVAIADLNGDGKLDLAVANNAVGTVSVLLGHGDGTFALRVDYATGPGPTSVAIGDLNGDTVPDLVVANSGSSTVSVLPGYGDGTFAPKMDYGTGGGPHSVAIADLDDDGKPDLAVANSASSTASVLLGHGDGTFAPKVDYATWNSPNCVAIGDLNGDGKPDLVTANASQPINVVSVLLGQGDGTFAAKVDYEAGVGPFFVAIRDLNGDGKLDLTVANNNASSVSVLLNVSPTLGVIPDRQLLLARTYPNPSSGTLSIEFTLPSAGNASLRLYDVAGRLVRSLVDGWIPSGVHRADWDRTSSDGSRVAPGVFFCELQAGRRRIMKRVEILH